MAWNAGFKKKDGLWKGRPGWFCGVKLKKLLQMIETGGSRIGCRGISTRLDGNHEILALFVVEAFHSPPHFIFIQTELRILADRQQHGMLVDFRANTVENLIGLHYIFLAEQFVGLSFFRVFFVGATLD